MHLLWAAPSHEKVRYVCIYTHTYSLICTLCIYVCDKTATGIHKAKREFPWWTRR